MAMKMKGQDGEEMTFATGGDTDTSDLNLEIYPGAEQEGATRFSGGDGMTLVVTCKTSDEFDKVAKFYKDKYPDAQKTEMTMGGQQLLTLLMEEEDGQRTVSVTQTDGDEEVVVILQRAKEATKTE